MLSDIENKKSGISVLKRYQSSIISIFTIDCMQILEENNAANIK